MQNTICRLKPKGRDAGVTLVEMLIVVAIIALLASMVIGVAAHIRIQGEQQLTKNVMAVLEGALEEYRDFYGYFPPQPDMKPDDAPQHSELLYGELYLVPTSRTILEKFTPSRFADTDGDVVIELVDPWNKPMDYIYDDVGGDNFPRLISAGPDKEFGTGDDIDSRKL